MGKNCKTSVNLMEKRAVKSEITEFYVTIANNAENSTSKSRKTDKKLRRFEKFTKRKKFQEQKRRKISQKLTSLNSRR